ncbi:MAG: PAS domain S-box protein, partial [Pseudomonadota bacterium]
MTALATPKVSELDPAAHSLLVQGDIIAECNERFSNIMRTGCDALIGKSLLDLSPEIQADGALSRERWQRRAQAARGGLPQWFPWQFRNADGRRVHALVHLITDTGSGGKLHVQAHDLTHLGSSGWIAPDTQARLQQVLDHSKAVIFVKDPAGRYVFANRELERVVRMPAERIIGHTDIELWPADIAERFCMNDAHVLEQRTAIEFEVSGTVSHQHKTFLCFKFPLLAEDGAPYAVCAIASDITDAKRTQDALTSAALAVSSAQSGNVFQELVRYVATILQTDAALIATIGRQDTGCQMHAQAFFLDGQVQDNFEYPLSGTPCETVIGQSFKFYASDICQMFPEDADIVRLGMQSYAAFPLSDATGAPVGVIAVLARAPMTNAELVESILKLFAVRAAAELERKRAEENLRRSEASYRAIFEASEDSVFIHDWDSGAIIDVNSRACETTGYTAEEIKRLGMAELSSGEFPYTGEEAARRIAEAKAGKNVRMDWQRRNKDGTLHWDEVVLRPAVIAGERRILAFTREITQRKQAEHALRQAQKMEALGHLTGGIAHDFNNLLTSIMGYVVLAADQPPAADPARRSHYLEQARLSCERARDLIRQMLTFSRGQRGQPRPVAIAPLVSESVKLFGSALPAAVNICTHLDQAVPAVMLDPVHLDQILLNLCLNAADAMGGTGTIALGIARTHAQEQVCTACRQAISGDFVALCVQDDGPGIAPDILDRIFDPFFTTKEVGKGSGMGLASVHGLAHEAGGHIIVDEAPERGTRFRVLFPVLREHEGDTREVAAVPAQAPRPRLHGHVLVVDDEHAVGAFMHDLLESWGLHVTVASSAQEALTLAADAAQRFDLIITDHKMPHMTGIQLARELQTRKPTLPVVLYTGFNEGISREDIAAARLRAVMTKPIDPHA